MSTPKTILWMGLAGVVTKIMLFRVWLLNVNKNIVTSVHTFDLTVVRSPLVNAIHSKSNR